MMPRVQYRVEISADAEKRDMVIVRVTGYNDQKPQALEINFPPLLKSWEPNSWEWSRAHNELTERIGNFVRDCLRDYV